MNLQVHEGGVKDLLHLVVKLFVKDEDLRFVEPSTAFLATRSGDVDELCAHRVDGACRCGQLGGQHGRRDRADALTSFHHQRRFHILRPDDAQVKQASQQRQPPVGPATHLTHSVTGRRMNGSASAHLNHFSRQVAQVGGWLRAGA
jgi:hypothetical protein